MTATWLIVLLFVAFICARLLRSTKMWWVFISAIMAGLLVGMLSKEAKSYLSKNDTASITQLIDTENIGDATCIQCVEAVTEGSTSRPGTVGYIVVSKPKFGALISLNTTNGRDSPYIEDDS